MSRVAVVGGGIAGLAAAYALATGEHPTEVVLLERDDRLGGKLRTSPFAGHPAIDEGPDAFLARLPWGTGLARAVGLGDALAAPTEGLKAAVYWERLHGIPEGLFLGMPTDVMAMARSHLMTWPGKLRAATEPFRRRTSTEADSLGGYVRARFGDEVHLRLVDPLVGSIYAADTDHFSMQAVPQIAELANKERSILLAGRKMPKPASGTASAAAAGPVFYAPRGGFGQLVDAVATAVRAAGGELRTNAGVNELTPDGRGWRVDGEAFDAVVLACPAPAAANLLRAVPTVPADAVDTLAAIPAADVVMVTMAVDKADWPEHLRPYSGYLVPKPQQRLVTAVSFGSQKWAHWADERQVILRVSLGRDGLPVLHLSDEQLLAAAVNDVGHHLGLTVQPLHARVSRWAGAFPQYRPQHAQRIAAVLAALPGGLALAGAGYHGIGMPACIRSAQQAAAAATNWLRPVAD